MRGPFVVFWSTLMFAYAGIESTVLVLGGRNWSTIILTISGVWSVNAVFLVIAFRQGQ